MLQMLFKCSVSLSGAPGGTRALPELEAHAAATGRARGLQRPVPHGGHRHPAAHEAMGRT